MILSTYCKDLSLISNYGENNHIENTALKMEMWNVPRHRFEFEYTSIPIKTISEQRAMFSYLDQLKQGYNTFIWNPPIYGTPSGTGSINPSVAATSAGSLTVLIDETLPGGDIVLPGDLVKFSNHTKVYTAASTLNSGNTTLTLNTPLQADLANGDTLITSNVEFTLIADPTYEAQKITRTGGDLYTTFGARFIEKL